MQLASNNPPETRTDIFPEHNFRGSSFFYQILVIRCPDDTSPPQSFTCVSSVCVGIVFKASAAFWQTSNASKSHWILLYLGSSHLLSCVSKSLAGSHAYERLFEFSHVSGKTGIRTCDQLFQVHLLSPMTLPRSNCIYLYCVLPAHICVHTRIVSNRRRSVFRLRSPQAMQVFVYFSFPSAANWETDDVKFMLVVRHNSIFAWETQT